GVRDGTPESIMIGFLINLAVEIEDYLERPETVEDRIADAAEKYVEKLALIWQEQEQEVREAFACDFDREDHEDADGDLDEDAYKQDIAEKVEEARGEFLEQVKDAEQEAWRNAGRAR